MPIQEGGRFSPTNTIVSPGVFTRENDLSGIVQGVADIGAVVVAPFAKGPGFSPTLVTSTAELEEKFGIADGTYYGPYTAKEYLNEKGFVTVCRVGGLTGYNQQYPLAIYAESGSWNRSADAASLVTASSFLTPSGSLTSGSANYLAGFTNLTFVATSSVGSYINGATFTATIPSASFLLTFASDAATATAANQTSGSKLFAGTSISISSNVYSSLTNVTMSWTGSTTLTSGSPFGTTWLLDYGLQNFSVSSSFGNTTLNGPSEPFTNVTLSSAGFYSYKGNCADVVFRLQGLAAGSFGPYNGTFTSAGSSSVDECGNWNTSSNATNQILLAVLNDTSNHSPNTSLVSPGFSGSNLNSLAPLNSNSSSVETRYYLNLSGSTAGRYGIYEFSLDKSDQKYLVNVFPKSAKTSDSTVNAYLYKTFEDSMAKVTANSSKYRIKIAELPNTGQSAFGGGYPLNFTDTNSLTPSEGDSQFSLTNAYTPYVVSQKIASVNGSTTRHELFKIHTLTDGTNANRLYKIEISDVKLAGSVPGSDWGTFTLSVRDFSDTDKRPKYLETFTNLNLDPDSANFIARRIGDRYNFITYSGKIIEYGIYANVSKYIRIAMSSEDYPVAAVPYGFSAYYTPLSGDISKVTPTMKYGNGSLYGMSIGKYPSGVVFNDVPGTDAELVSLYPTASTGVPVYNDNLQYFSPIPSNPSAGNNTAFGLDNTIVGSNTGSILAASLSGSIPPTNPDDVLESTYVKMRKFVFGFQGGFDGQSPSVKINLGGDIVAGNTQGLDCTNISSAGSVAYKQCVAAVGNADEFDLNLIVTPGILHQQHSYVADLVIDMCESRGDCFYIMDNVVFPNSGQSVGLIDAAVSDVATIDSNYVATYYPWVRILDTNTNKIISVPPSVVLPAVYAANDNVAAEWFAPAGLNRGGIPQAVQVLDRTTHSERDELYEGRVNPIAAFPGQGICVWGQKTLQAKASALDRVNVRRLLIALKKYIASTSRYLVFEQNVAATRNRFLSIVNPYLESVQQRSGLYAFQVKMDETNNTPDIIDRNILYGQIYLQPTRTSEFIVLDFNVLPTGAQFPGA
jgi:hypothetical protein